MGDVGCTVRNFVDGCILDAHPLGILFGTAVSFVPIAIFIFCISILFVPPLAYGEQKKKLENEDRNEQD